MGADIIVTSATGARWMIGNGIDPFSDGYDFIDFDVALKADGLEARTTVRSIEGSAGLASFLGELAEDWKGVVPRRRWESIEHDMGIETDRDSLGHVVLTVWVRESYRADAWRAQATFEVDAGEQMAELARAVARLLRVNR